MNGCRNCFLYLSSVKNNEGRRLQLYLQLQRWWKFLEETPGIVTVSSLWREFAVEVVRSCIHNMIYIFLNLCCEPPPLGFNDNIKTQNPLWTS